MNHFVRKSVSKSVTHTLKKSKKNHSISYIFLKIYVHFTKGSRKKVLFLMALMARPLKKMDGSPYKIYNLSLFLW